MLERISEEEALFDSAAGEGQEDLSGQVEEKVSVDKKRRSASISIRC